MTQQYIVGEFPSLLGDLQRAPGQRLAAVHDLRREVELSPPTMLPPLAHKALRLTDMICWAALERGDTSGFSHYSKGAAALRAFTDNPASCPTNKRTPLQARTPHPRLGLKRSPEPARRRGAFIPPALPARSSPVSILGVHIPPRPERKTNGQRNRQMV